MNDFKKGPFVMVDGKPQDAELFKNELSQESEDSTDSIFFLKSLNQKAKEEKARRTEIKESVDASLATLMESFK